MLLLLWASVSLPNIKPHLGHRQPTTCSYWIHSKMSPFSVPSSSSAGALKNPGFIVGYDLFCVGAGVVAVAMHPQRKDKRTFIIWAQFNLPESEMWWVDWWPDSDVCGRKRKRKITKGKKGSPSQLLQVARHNWVLVCKSLTLISFIKWWFLTGMNQKIQII